MRRGSGLVTAGGRRRQAPAGRPRVGRRRLRAVLTVAGVLLVAAGTQVIPAVPVPRVEGLLVAAALPGLPFQTRIEANQQKLSVAAAAAEAAGKLGRARAYRRVLTTGRQLLSVDPDANKGRGAWIELVGTIDESTRAVGLIVPGSAAFILDGDAFHDNFEKYHQRASDLVEQANGALAMVVWAGGRFPKGWIQGALSRYHAPLGRSLAKFSHELHAELGRALGPDQDVRVVVLGHSFGGAVVGASERYGLVADAVLHVASAGMGKVGDPYDYQEPTRPRYAMTAPGDLIGFVQGLPGPPGLGHGPAPGSFRCVTELPVGHLPDDPAARDEFGNRLGERAGAAIAGIPSHSHVFIKFSDAWWEIYRVLVGAVPDSPVCPQPDDPAPVRVRSLPLVVPRVVTASQCRAGSGLRPRGRHRSKARPTS